MSKNLSTSELESRELPEYPVQKLLEMKDPTNPRWMPEQQKASLQISLKRFSMLEPVIVNLRTNQVIGGHQRIDAAIALGLETLPVEEVDISQEEQDAFNVGLNKNRGEWDYELLPLVLAEIQDPDLLAATGFTQDEHDAICKMNQVTEIENEDGVERELDNKTEEEVQAHFAATEKINFGMFTLTFPTATYTRWIQMLTAEAGGESATIFDLNNAVARRLGLSLDAPAEEQDDEDQPFTEFNIDELGDESDDE